MKFFGFGFKTKTPAAADEKASAVAVTGNGNGMAGVLGGGWTRLILEPFTGAWQRNQDEVQADLLCYPTLYACVSRIAQDIGKLTYQLKARNSDGIWNEVTNTAYSPVLRKQNHYQTQQQFRESWMLSKLLQGNTYILKQRDERGVVVKLYVLDPFRVRPMVSTAGDVFYDVQTDFEGLIPTLNGQGLVSIPAREIIHDRAITLHHPLIGVPPLCASYWPAAKNLRILRSQATFFGNNSQPGGILTAPGSISPETATRLQEYWNANFTGENAGRTAVVGDGLKYEQMAQKAADAQLVEQMRYSDEQICQPFGIPPFKIGIGSIPAGMKVDDINQLYYSDALQTHVDAMENLLDEGLAISPPLGVELDLWPLLRMDAQKQAAVEKELVGGAIKTPNEARRKFDLAPQEGGDSIYLQQQYYSLQSLAKRDALANPFGKELPPAATPSPAPELEDVEEPSDEAKRIAIEAQFTAQFMEHLQKGLALDPAHS